MKIDGGVSVPTAVTVPIVGTQGFLINGPPVNTSSATTLVSSSVASSSNDGQSVQQCPFSSAIKVANFSSKKSFNDTLYHNSKGNNCNEKCCQGPKAAPTASTEQRTPVEILEEAYDFLLQFYKADKSKTEDDFSERFSNVRSQIEKTGTYSLTFDELQFGAKTAWRNASRCIGRLFWNKLQIQDARHISTCAEMFEAICHHLKYATNGGQLRPYITVFPQRLYNREDFRVWNPQLVTFAGYEMNDGTVLGDRGSIEFTKVCTRLGWKGKGSAHDILPIVVSAPDEPVKFFDIPEELILLIDLEHPVHAWFKDLGLKWFALPAVSSMMFDVGGLEFTAAPFNGWYMGTEIGARDMCDPHRYNLTETFAKKLNLDTTSAASLWKDEVLVQVNIAVLYSFRKNGVTIVDHHTASEQFSRYFQNEHATRGGCPADWGWIVPPMSASLTPVFHQEMINYKLRPSFEYQENAWKTHCWLHSAPNLKHRFVLIARTLGRMVLLLKKTMAKREKVTVLFATESGKSEAFAHKLGKLIHVSFQVQIMCMEDYNFSKIAQEKIMLLVCSTFGSGEPPDNAKEFFRSLNRLKCDGSSKLSSLKYGVFALGSSQYATFCEFGKHLDQALYECGAERIHEIGFGDDMLSQEVAFVSWKREMYKKLCNIYNISTTQKAEEQKAVSQPVYDPQNFRLHPVCDQKEDKSYILHQLSRIHRKQVFPCNVLSRKKFLPEGSEKQIALIKLSPSNGLSKNMISYEPGDHIGVFPSNPTEMVNVILKHISAFTNHELEDTVYQLEICSDGQWHRCKRIPACSIRSALTNYLDISNTPSPEFLGLLSQLANDNRDQFQLTKLSKDAEQYKKWRVYYCPNLVYLIQRYPSLHLTPEFLLSELPLMQPRLYSISNSPNCTPDEVHLTMRIVSYSPPAYAEKGIIKHGICSSYLGTTAENEVPCFIRQCQSFRLPEKPSTPIILIAAGSGIAPFRAFWQERKAQLERQERCGQMILFYGCRNEEVDHIYKEELLELSNRGIIHEVFLAESRKPGQRRRKYVQDIVFTQRCIIYWLVYNRDGHIYVCGETAMAESVKLSVKKAIMTEGRLSEEEANAFFDRLIMQERYHEDVFGAIPG